MDWDGAKRISRPGIANPAHGTRPPQDAECRSSGSRWICRWLFTALARTRLGHNPGRAL